MRISNIPRRVKSLLYAILNRCLYGSIRLDSRIFSPLKVTGKRNIYFGRAVTIEYKSWLTALAIENGVVPRLEIGDGSIIGHFNHIYATKSIKIGKNVLTADRVYISDNLHAYEDINTPIMHQEVKQINVVEIGDGSWLGEGVCVLGAKIGKGCVIGSNSVVTKDIPDYCVAVGAPARVIKRFNFTTQKWEKV